MAAGSGHPPTLLFISPSATSFEMFMLDCLTIYTGNPCNVSLLSKHAVSAAGDPKPRPHPGNPGAGRGRHECCEGAGHRSSKAKSSIFRECYSTGAVQTGWEQVVVVGLDPLAASLVIAWAVQPQPPRVCTFCLCNRAKWEFSGGVSFLPGNSS